MLRPIKTFLPNLLVIEQTKLTQKDSHFNLDGIGPNEVSDVV